MKLNDLPLSLTVAACITAAALMAMNAKAQSLPGPEFPIDLAELKPAADARLAEFDTDDDGLLSSAEFEAAEMLPDRGPRDGWRRDRGRRDGWGRDRGRRDGWGRDRGRRDGWRSDRGHGGNGAEVFSEADVDSDEKLSQEEFEAVPEAIRRLAQRRLFGRLDANDDASLSAEELPSRYSRLVSLDANEDGKVTRDEIPRRGRRGHR